MKSIAFLIAFVITLQNSLTAQSGFFGRKYTKGFFFEKKRALKHKKSKHETLSVINSITENSTALTNTTKKINSDTHFITQQEVVSIEPKIQAFVSNNVPVEKQTYGSIKKHNTISVSNNQLMSSTDKHIQSTRYSTVALKTPENNNQNQKHKTLTDSANPVLLVATYSLLSTALFIGLFMFSRKFRVFCLILSGIIAISIAVEMGPSASVALVIGIILLVLGLIQWIMPERPKVF